MEKKFPLQDICKLNLNNLRFLLYILFLIRWSECGSPSNSGGTELKIAEGCATLNIFGLNDVNCDQHNFYICSTSKLICIYRIFFELNESKKKVKNRRKLMRYQIQNHY